MNYFYLTDYFCKNGFPRKSTENNINILVEKFNSDKTILPSYDILKKKHFIAHSLFSVLFNEIPF